MLLAINLITFCKLSYMYLPLSVLDSRELKMYHTLQRIKDISALCCNLWTE